MPSIHCRLTHCLPLTFIVKLDCKVELVPDRNCIEFPMTIMKGFDKITLEALLANINLFAFIRNIIKNKKDS